MGRERELRVLDAVLHDAGGGRGHAIVVEGEAGIGKTRLLQETAGRAERKGFEVASAAGQELETGRPFLVLGEALGCHADAADPARRKIASLLGDAGTGAAPVAQFTVIDAMLDLVETLAARRPLLLTLDDLQWSDAPTLVALSSLRRRLSGLPVALVAAFRPVPRRHDLDRIATALADGGTRIDLGPLDRSTVVALAQQILGVRPSPALIRLLRRAGGNPFLLTELLTSLLRAGTIEVGPVTAALRDDRLPAEWRTAVGGRLGFLSEAARSALRAASVLGSSFSVQELSLITGRTSFDLSEYLHEAIDAGLVIDAGDRIEFRHDLIREALYDALARDEQRVMHREVGRLLAEAGASADRVATHLSLGAERGDAEAVGWLRRAAREASAGPSIAADLLGRAQELCMPDDPAIVPITAERIVALVACGNPVEAERLARDFLARFKSDLTPIVRHALAQSLFLLGRRQESAAEMEEAAREFGLTAADRGRYLAEAALGRLFGLGDLQGARALAAEASDIDSRDPLVRAMALCVLSGVEGMQGNAGEAVRLASEAVALSGDEVLQTWGNARMFLGSALIDADALDEAREALRRGLRIGEERGAMGWSHFYHYWMGLRSYHAGDWDDAVAELEAGLSHAEEFESRGGSLGAHALAGLIAFHRDDIAEARRQQAVAEADLAATGPDFGADWLVLLQALLLEHDGNAGAAAAAATGAWQMMESIGSVFHYRMLGPEVVRLALASGSRDDAEAVAAALERFAAGTPVASVTAAAARCRCLLDRDPDPLAALLESGGLAPRPFDEALAAEVAAMAVAPASPGDARPLFERALAGFEAVGAARPAVRAAAAMRTFGLRRGTRGSRRRPAHGWESLTATERRIAALVAEGLSNPEIGLRLYISRRTVQTHLSRVFAKLGVTGRSELAAQAARNLE